MQVTLTSDGFQFEAGPDETVLDAARRAGVQLPSACRGGRCGLCAAGLLSGQVRYPDGPPAAARLQTIDPTDVLLCRAHALTDLRLDVRPMRGAGTPRVHRLPARVASVERLGSELAKVWLKLPRAEPFVFRAGQYLDIVLGDGARRSYSIASPPHDRDLIELHVRRGAPGGRGAALFDALAPKLLLEIEGPRGAFAYEEPAPAQNDVPLLLIAGGTGFAPVKSILRHVLDAGSTRRLEVYWGVRRRVELYDHDWLAGASRDHPNLHYRPVLSEETAPDPAFRTGLVGTAVLSEHADLSGTEVYAAGPPAMLAALRPELVARGLPGTRFHSDQP